MEIFALSLNHRVTPLAVREKVAFDQAEGERFLETLRERHGVKEALLVSTCNRTEIYAALETESRPGDRDGAIPPEEGETESGEPIAADAGLAASLSLEQVLLEILAETRGFQPSRKPPNYELYRGEDAVRHLFCVSSGLDSQILGESQILGQVKKSLAWSQAAGTKSRTLHRLWERSLRVGKRVRTETAIGAGALSASYAALELARKIFGRLDDKKVLLIGTGEIGLLVLEDLKGVPLRGLTIMNRTRSVAEDLARRFGAEVRDLAELPEVLVDSDLVVSSTGAREPLIRYEQMKKVRSSRRGARPLLVIDLAVPRDFEESCGTLDEVFLKNVDDLTEIVQSNIAERREEIPHAEAIIEREVASFFRWVHTLDVEPTIRKLRELFHSIRAEELSMLGGQLEDETLRRVDRLSERIVNRLLHVLSSNLRRHEGLRDQELISVIHQILTEEIPYPHRPGASRD